MDFSFGFAFCGCVGSLYSDKSFNTVKDKKTTTKIIEIKDQQNLQKRETF